mgnify:FL=1
MYDITILIVEDDKILANEFKEYLNKYGYQVNLIENFSKVLNECMNICPDLILMDINLPFYDGFYWCSKIREYSQVPMIFISSRNSDNDKIMAIAQGGDDYVEKPFNLPVLRAKIEAITRRTYQYKVNQKIYIKDNIFYDYSNNCIYFKNEKVDLTKSENIIIKVLLEEKDKVVSRNALMDELWNTDEFISDNTLTVLISRLRLKLKDVIGDELICTKNVQGYYLE